MPQAFSGQTDAKQLEIVNQLIEELTKEQAHLLEGGASSPDTLTGHQGLAGQTFLPYDS
jgi:hypothetical protein